MIKSIRTDDFTGGLNYDANAFSLDNNETNDALNVDFNPKGGVSTRWGFKRLNTTAIGGGGAGSVAVNRLFPWNNTSRRLLVSTSTAIYAYPSTSTAGALDNLSITHNATYGAGFATWDDRSTNVVYVSCGFGNAGRKISGTTVTSLTSSGTGAWQNDLTNPNGTHMPRAQMVVAHAERLWVANTSESSVEYPNRVRFSHPLFPESWREDDYIDVVAGGPKITGIVAFNGVLVIFKDKAVFALYGFNEETFQLVDISRSVGAVAPNCIAQTERGIYFFSNPEGVFFYDGTSLKDVFEPIRPLLIDSEISEQAVQGMSMGYANRRLYLSLPAGQDVVDILAFDSSVEEYDKAERNYDGGTRAALPTRTFVYDETVGNGCWTAYQTSDGFGLVCPVDFLQQDSSILHVAAHPYQPYLLTIDVRENGSADNITGTDVAFESYWTTKWQDAKNVGAKKFWRRPEFIFRREVDVASVRVDVYQDWDSFTPIKYFMLTPPEADPNVGNWQSWGEPEFGASHLFADSLGLARSVRLKISNNSTSPWAVYSIVYRFNPRKNKV